MNKKHVLLQVTLTLFLTAVGVAPGLIWFREADPTRFYIIVGLGGLIGFLISLPGVSGERIFGALTLIAVRDAPSSIRRMVSNEVDGYSGQKDFKQIKEQMASKYAAEDETILENKNDESGEASDH